VFCSKSPEVVERKRDVVLESVKKCKKPQRSAEKQHCEALEECFGMRKKH
jgi:hypothetical protein